MPTMQSFIIQVGTILKNQILTPSNGKLLIKFIFLFLLFSQFAYCAESADGSMERIMKGLKGWIPTVKGACLWVFFTFVLIDLTWTFGKMALSGFELGEFIFTLIKKVIFIGVILFLFNIDQWLDIIFKSFTKLATDVSNGNKITPNNIIGNAVDIVLIILKSMSLMSPGDSFFKVITGLMILILFVLMAIDLLMAYIKFYLLNVLVFFALAFSGLERFKEYGINPILTAVKVGIEVFMIQGLMALCITMMNEAFGDITRKSDMGLVLGVLVIAMIFCIITKNIPGHVEAIFHGGLGETASASSGFRAVAAMTGIAAASTVAGAVGATRAIQAAKDLHIAEGGKGSGMDMIKGVAKNLATTAGEHLRDNLSKGRMPNDIANRLQEKIKAATSASSDSSSGTISSGSSDAASNDEPYVSGVNNA